MKGGWGRATRAFACHRRSTLPPAWAPADARAIGGGVQKVLLVTRRMRHCKLRCGKIRTRRPPAVVRSQGGQLGVRTRQRPLTASQPCELRGARWCAVVGARGAALKGEIVQAVPQRAWAPACCAGQAPPSRLFYTNAMWGLRAAASQEQRKKGQRASRLPAVRDAVLGKCAAALGRAPRAVGLTPRPAGAAAGGWS
jgi:hypothetical protein